MIRINSIVLKNFRCYTSNNVVFLNNINILLGNNATGKTSIVEAIGLLSVGHSFRTNNDKELIKNDQEAYFVEYNISDNKEKSKVSIAFDGKVRRIVVNGKQIKNLKDFIGKYKVISFIPEDIRIIVGEPKLRRKFLDYNISIYNQEYLSNLVTYNRVLKERNEVLKNYKEKNDEMLLKTYTDKLVECGKRIIEARESFINEINTIINTKVEVLSDNKDNSSVMYKPNVDKDDFENSINKAKERDIAFATTTVGPHRDDFDILINNKSASSYGSQGQIKTVALGIKLCCVDIVKKINDNILIVLDDVFGELDEIRQNQILKLLKEDYQMFITTTSINGIDENILNNSNILNINDIRR